MFTSQKKKVTETTPSYPTQNHAVREEKLLIRYISESDIIAISGRSTGLEVLPAYTRLIDNTKRHFQSSDRINCYFRLSVINASTTKLLFNLFSLLQSESKKGNQVVIYWVVEEYDEDLVDIGLDFKNEFDLDFQITVK